MLKNIRKNDLMKILFVFIFFYVILLLISLKPVFSYDAYWHLKMGKDLIVNGLSTGIDHYSFTMYGNEIKSVPIMFQVLIYQFVNYFGETTGFYLVKASYVSLLFVALYYYFKKIQAPWFVVLIVLSFLTYYIYLRLIVRPEIISNIFIVISMILYLKARENFAHKQLIYICFLLLFWVNYHTPIFGYIIIFGLFLDKGINKIVEKDDDFSWLFYISWGLVVFLIGFVNASGQHFFINMLLMVDSGFAKYTEEYRSSLQFYSKNIVVSLMWILSIYVGIWSVIKKQYGFAVISIILAYHSMTMVRLITPVALINFCILALYLSQLSYEKSIKQLKPAVRNTLILVVSMISLLAIYESLKVVKDVWQKFNLFDDLVHARYPVEASDYLKSFHEGGRILNPIASGGYLINSLAPEYKVHFDGRTNILYPIEFFEHALNISHSAEGIKAEVERYDINYAINKNNPDNFKYYLSSGVMQLNFSDVNFIVFSKDNKIAFPYSSALMIMPMCWTANSVGDKVKQIKYEIRLADEMFKEKDYGVEKVLYFLEGYINSNNKMNYINEYKIGNQVTDSVRRILAYAALDLGSIEISFNYFKGIGVKTDDDLLMLANILIVKEDYIDAESLLNYFYRLNKFIRKKNVPYERIAVLSKLIGVIHAKTNLRGFTREYRVELEEKLVKVNFNNGEEIVSVIPYQKSCELAF